MFHVSVPSRGITFLNVTLEELQQSLMSFRPLTGNNISKHAEYENDADYRTIVSVPSRGITFLNRKVGII